MLTAVYERRRHSHERHLMRLAAFLGRYAHQPYDSVMRMPITRMMLLAQETGEMLREEAEKREDAMRGLI